LRPAGRVCSCCCRSYSDKAVSSPTRAAGEEDSNGREEDGEGANDGVLPSTSNWPHTLCAVDMGTNSFHMVIVKADDEGRFVVVDQMKEEVRLLSGTGRFNFIMEEPEVRAIAVLQRLKKIASSKNAELRLVATSAVREARNGAAFMRQAQEAIKTPIEIISGLEEARLAYMGAMRALPIFDKTVLLVDIGGGSTEILLGKQGKPLFAISLKLGHLRLFESTLGPLFLPPSAEVPDPGLEVDMSREKMRECRRKIRLVLAESTIKEEILDIVRENPIDFAVGSSGTIERVEAMISAQRVVQSKSNGRQEKRNSSEGKKAELEESKFNRREVNDLVAAICRCKNRKERSDLPGINEKRVDLIVTGALILEEVMEYLGLDVMKVSPFALREGVIVDTLSKVIPGYAPTQDIRRDSLMHLAMRFDTENRLKSAKHSAKLAKMLIDSFRSGPHPPKELEALSETDEFLLESGILLHSVGMFVNHSKHHKHAYYIIKNSDMLLGFMPLEIEILALLALFHRKKYPSKKNTQFDNIPKDAQAKVIAMTSIIRLSIALDRRNTAFAVESVAVLQDGDGCVLMVTPGVDDQGNVHDVSFEIWAAKQEIPYFKKVFGRSATVIEGDRVPQ